MDSDSRLRALKALDEFFQFPRKKGATMTTKAKETVTVAGILDDFNSLPTLVSNGESAKEALAENLDLAALAGLIRLRIERNQACYRDSLRELGLVIVSDSIKAEMEADAKATKRGGRPAGSKTSKGGATAEGALWAACTKAADKAEGGQFGAKDVAEILGVEKLPLSWSVDLVAAKKLKKIGAGKGTKYKLV